MLFDEWLALRPVIRSPIPYFMIGLDAYSDEYVREAARPTPQISKRKKEKRLEKLDLQKLEIWSKYNVPHTPHNRMIMDCFGITAKTLKTKLVGPISTEMQSGTITFVAGSSGCGKSILLSPSIRIGSRRRSLHSAQLPQLTIQLDGSVRCRRTLRCLSILRQSTVQSARLMRWLEWGRARRALSATLRDVKQGTALSCNAC